MAGVAATVVNDAVMTPADVVKQRLQVSKGQNVSMLKCIVGVWQEGGIAAFYRCGGSISCGMHNPELVCLKADMCDDCATLSLWSLTTLLCRSYPATLLMNIPWTILHFPIYESSKKLLAPGREGREGTVVELASGGLAGGIAAALTTPFDVVKTRLQLGSDSPVPARQACIPIQHSEKHATCGKLMYLANVCSTTQICRTYLFLSFIVSYHFA